MIINNISPNINYEGKIGSYNIIAGNVYFGRNVSIGNNCTINTKNEEQKIYIGDNTVIKNNVIIEGNVIIGNNNNISSGCIIGSNPQHKSFIEWQKNQTIIIGDNNTIREYSIIDMPFVKQTKIGNYNFIMNNVTVAHDVVIEDNIVISAGACLGGHSLLQSYSNIGLNSEIHQFCQIGKYSMVGMGTSLKKDLLPFHIFYKNKLSVNFMGISKNLNFKNFSFSNRDFSENILLFKNKKKIKNKELSDIFNFFIENTKLGYYNWEDISASDN